MSINWKELAKTTGRVDYRTARKLLDEAGVTLDTVIMREDFEDALKVRANTYNPDDLGMYGKLDEQAYRLSVTRASWIRWSFFRAHDPSRSDSYNDSRRVENKTGAGDWFKAEGSYTRVMNVMMNCRKKYRWSTEWFCIVCTLEELCEYLAKYNAKGLDTWFPASKAETREATTVIRMQEWKTSGKKIRYLQECPFNTEK